MNRLTRQSRLVRLALALSLAWLLVSDVAGWVYADAAADAALLAEGEARQVIQFNPSAALQKRIFADNFVPNSPEFGLTVNGVAYTGQRAEDLGTGHVRVYYVVVGDWANVQTVERGAAGAAGLGATLLAEGEARQVIQFNPSAALQKRIFSDGFVPNSSEFGVTVNGVAYAGQRAENLGSGQVRVYYVVVGDWGNVQTATRGAPATSAPASPPRLNVETVVGGLDTPWALAFAPDGRFFITERPGRIRVVKDGQLQPEAWLTLDVVESGESGLLGLALDPQFAQNGYVYVAYTAARFQNRLVRLREDPATGKGVFDRVLLEGALGANNHDGGRVRFGPDGKLYWTMGDAQNPSLAQDTASLNGKILRLNPDGSVPADNPFPGFYVYSLGHRNPQGLAWQPGTGRLYATEHGPSGGAGPEQGGGRDEVNLIEAGANYGWPLITGDQGRSGLVSPVLHSGTQATWAPGGATFVTRGPWAGSLLFVGLRGQSLYRVVLDPANPRAVASFEGLLQGQYGRLRDVVEGPDGAIYLTTSNRDGRGSPAATDDRVLRLIIE
ncbi:MAG: PQQ-dependent sugar dehydrogenase [Anaerolineae bacterium]|nr:PQQ-dependent sugar dehydrogenase [Anaerolineae bacterium]